jgi:molybdenum cofactor biosynthesis enzyme
VVDNIDIQLQIAGKNKTSVYCECWKRADIAVVGVWAVVKEYLKPILESKNFILNI